MRTYQGWAVDFSAPAGEPAFTGPESVSWRVFKNPAALAIGGVAAVLLEFADPRIRTGVWEHSVFKTDPIGRSRRTGMAAMVGVYGPQSAARRVIAGVNRMHAQVSGTTPGGAAYRALDPDLLDWVSATAGYGFLAAYDRFVRPISLEEERRFFAEGAPVAALYGVRQRPQNRAAFAAMTAARLPDFEPHPIVTEFLEILTSRRAAPLAPRGLKRALAKAAVALLPTAVRERLTLGPAYDLGGGETALIRALAGAAEAIPDRSSPAAQACRRLGLPADFLWRTPQRQARDLGAAAVVTPGID